MRPEHFERTTQLRAGSVSLATDTQGEGPVTLHPRLCDRRRCNMSSRLSSLCLCSQILSIMSRGNSLLFLSESKLISSKLCVCKQTHQPITTVARNGISLIISLCVSLSAEPSLMKTWCNYSPVAPKIYFKDKKNPVTKQQVAVTVSSSRLNWCEDTDGNILVPQCWNHNHWKCI